MHGSLIKWLEGVNGEIQTLEQQAKKVLETSDYKETYRQLMLRKAKLLADLPAEYDKMVKNDPGLSNDFVFKNLQNFSENANTAMKLDSVFYMSALLYPDEHKAGEPNNLELLITKIR